MNRTAALTLTALLFAQLAEGQTATPTPSATQRGFFGRMLHPFQSSGPALPQYKDAKLRGLLLELQISAQPVKLSEVRQLEVKLVLSNHGKRAVPLDFPTTQRFEIELKNSFGDVLTRWSDNHAFDEERSAVVVDPDEHLEYSETIATRDLTANKVFIVEAYFPKYPELRAQKKFMTAP